MRYSQLTSPRPIVSTSPDPLKLPETMPPTKEYAQAEAPIFLKHHLGSSIVYLFNFMQLYAHMQCWRRINWSILVGFLPTWTQTIVTWEKGLLIEKLHLSDWSVGIAYVAF